MPEKGSLRAIKDARTKKRTAEERREAEFGALAGRVTALEQKVDSVRKILQDLVSASNASSLLLSSVERWLDVKHPGWDEGIRADLERRAGLLAEQKQLHMFAGVPVEAEGGPTREERGKAGARLWEVAKEVGSTLQDGPLSVSLLLQGRDAAGARAVLAEYRGLHPEVPPQLDAVLRKLEERSAKVERGDRRLWLPGDR